MPYVFNPFTGNFDYTAAAGASIPQLTADPASPAAEDAWVLYTAAALRPQTSLFPLGMALLTGTPATYQFSYRTNEGTTKRVSLA